MIIFDILYRTFFDFLNNKLKRGKDNAKMSALCFLCLYLTVFINSIIAICGLINDNNFSKLVLKSGENIEYLFLFLFSVILFLIFGIRYYYTNKEVEKIDLNKRKYRIIKIICILFIIIVPVMSFCVYRLYLFGYI